MIICRNDILDIFDKIKNIIKLVILSFDFLKTWLLDNLKLHMWFTFVAYILFPLKWKYDVAFFRISHDKVNYLFSFTSFSILETNAFLYLVSNVGIPININNSDNSEFIFVLTAVIEFSKFTIPPNRNI